MKNLAGVVFEQTLRFPAGQPLIDHFHGNAKLLAKPLAKTSRFLGHFAARSVQTQRQSYDNLPDGVNADDFAEAAHVFVTVDALQRVEWLRQRGSLIGKCKTDARAAVVDAEDAGSADCAGQRFFRAAIGWRHPSSIPGSWLPGI